MVLMGLVVAITLVGLQAVGLILIIALLVIPAAAALFWTDSMPVMLVLASIGGAISGGVGALISASYPKLPSGPMIVLVSAGFFLVSLLAGSRRGIVLQLWSQAATKARIEKQHLLRAIYERLEAHTGGSVAASGERTVATAELEPMRSWSRRSLQRIMRRCEREGWVQRWADDSVRLTAKGYHEAARLVHEHRLLELYLISHADVAPAQVDRGADTIEHFLNADMIARLEEQLGRSPGPALPDSPHKIEGSASPP
jgi:manganese/zinc/iron transport system permease protein